MGLTTENYTGANCTGSSGDVNRILIISNTKLTNTTGFSVTAGGLTLTLTTEYTVEHKAIDSEITFLNPLWDDQGIVVTYGITITSIVSGGISTGMIDAQIELLGELVTLTVKSNKTYSDWGDESSTETETANVKAVFNVYGQPNAFQEEGKFQEGNLTFFFKSDQANIIRGTKVTRADGDVYSIMDIMDHGVQGNVHVYEAKVEKI